MVAQKPKMNGNGNGGRGGDWRGVISVAMGALSILGGVVWWAMTTQFSQLQHQFAVLRAENSSALATQTAQFQHMIDVIRAEYTTTYTRVEEIKRIDGQIQDIKTRLTRLADQINAEIVRTAGLYLTKDAYLGPHQALIQQVQNNQDRLNELRSEFGKIYTPTDTIKELQDRIKGIETKVYAGKKD